MPTYAYRPEVELVHADRDAADPGDREEEEGADRHAQRDGTAAPPLRALHR